MEQPKNYLEALEIDRGDEWLGDALEDVVGFLKQKGKVLQNIAAEFLAEEEPEAIMFIATIPSLSSALVHLCQLLFHVGYLKGLSDGESKAARDEQLKKLLGE